MITQPWERSSLDKDLLIPGNKHYSAETCVFVDQATNKLLNDNAAMRGDLPQGVSQSGRGFQAQLRIKGKQVYFGTYITPELASNAYVAAKANEIRRTALLQTDDRVRMALLSRADTLTQTPVAL